MNDKKHISATAPHRLHARIWLVKTSFCPETYWVKWRSALWIHTTVDVVCAESFWKVMSSTLNSHSHCKSSPQATTLQQAKHNDTMWKQPRSLKQVLTPSMRPQQSHRTEDSCWHTTPLTVETHGLANCCAVPTAEHARIAVCSDYEWVGWMHMTVILCWISAIHRQGTAQKHSVICSHHLSHTAHVQIPQLRIPWPSHNTHESQGREIEECPLKVNSSTSVGKDALNAQWNSSESCHERKFTHPPHPRAHQSFPLHALTDWCITHLTHTLIACSKHGEECSAQFACQKLAGENILLPCDLPGQMASCTTKSNFCHLHPFWESVCMLTIHMHVKK